MPRSSETVSIAAPAAGVRQRLSAYFALSKPRVVLMILVTTLAGYYLGAPRSMLDLATALRLLVGTALAAGGTLALNQYFERDLDALMERTRHRPLPAGRLIPIEALLFGIVAFVTGFAYLGLKVNWTTAGVIAVIALLYLGAYTPLKRYTWVCNVVGALPGALPPIAGWLAVRPGLSAEPLILFGIMYLWQVPHTLAIARLYRHDYERAGIHIYPPDGPRGNAANLITVGISLVLLAVSLMPRWLGFAGRIYFWLALPLGLWMLICGIGLARRPETATARRVLMASLIYLPLVLLALVIDRI
jgi:protoheme IX farnesyltransferase